MLISTAVPQPYHVTKDGGLSLDFHLVNGKPGTATGALSSSWLAHRVVRPVLAHIGFTAKYSAKDRAII